MPKQSGNRTWGPGATPTFRPLGLCRFSPIYRRIRAPSLRDLPAIF